MQTKEIFEWTSKGDVEVSGYRTSTPDSEPKIVRIKGKTFNYRGHDFAYIRKKMQGEKVPGGELYEWMPFLHLHSGAGIGLRVFGYSLKTLTDAKESFIKYIEEHVGQEKFEQVIKDTMSLEERFAKDLAECKSNRESITKKFKTLQELTKLTGVPFKHDKMLLTVGVVSWDIIATDKALKNRYREFYPDDMSMSQCIERQFGAEVLGTVKTLLE